MAKFYSGDLDILEKADLSGLNFQRVYHRLVETLDDAIDTGRTDKAERARNLLRLLKKAHKRLTLQSMMDTPIELLEFEKCAPVLKEIALKAEECFDTKRAEQARTLFRDLLARGQPA